MKKKNTINSKGFSLVELSVVLIILGLLAAGITAGNSLVQGAKLRAVVAELEQFNAAHNAFILQYDYKPGDMPNASSYWTGAVDGNGDGLVSGATEEPLAWNHLTNADLLPGNYNGTNQFPISKFRKNSLYTYRYHTAVYNEDHGPLSVIMLRDSNLGGWNPALTPREASQIDKKIDDGIPNKGTLFAWGDSTPSHKCAIDGGGSTQYFTYTGTAPLKYDLDETTAECLLSDARYTD